MVISDKILSLAGRLCAELEVPPIAGLHLPELRADEDFHDEFGFVFLADGTAAPFYVSLSGTLPELHRRFPEPSRAQPHTEECLAGFSSEGLPERALALGVWNALSQFVLRRAGFHCPPRGSAGGSEPRVGELIGMIGYFCPVIDRLVAKGAEVLVIEQQPGRVPPRPQVRLSQDSNALRDCRLVYCTASTLINDSLQQVLDCCVNAEAVALIGPSGSGLPDVLFEHGIHAVGGVSFADSAELRRLLAQRESWGPAGHKYELTADNYPGVDTLLERAVREVAIPID